MKNKYIPLIIIVIAAIVLTVLMSFKPGQGLIQTSSAVQVPQVLLVILTGFLFALLTIVFTYILQHLGLDLIMYARPLAVTLATFLIAVVQHWIDLQPITSDPYILTVLNVLVVILAGYSTLLIVSGQHKNLI